MSALKADNILTFISIIEDGRLGPKQPKDLRLLLILTRKGHCIQYIAVMIPKHVQKVLDANGLHVLEFEPGSTPTSELAAQRIGVQVAQIAKSILLLGKDGKYRMAVLRGDRKLASGKFKQVTGVKHCMASPEETLERPALVSAGFAPLAYRIFQSLLIRA